MYGGPNSEKVNPETNGRKLRKMAQPMASSNHC